ncbi:MAG: hypothetical protein P4L50_00410 [Anaerolineaceae bacterium]|nr:hypothetical protein [Anaerolineaceae bacterium]
MSFDDNYHTNAAVDAVDDASTYDLDWRALVSSARLEDFDTSWITRTIQDQSSWLQGRPHSAPEIISALFPRSVKRMKDLATLVPFIGGFLFDAGYTPRWDNPDFPTWYWGMDEQNISPKVP